MGLDDPLEKGMATHSSVLAWKIPWTEEAGGLQSMRSQESDMTQRLNHQPRNVNIFGGTLCCPPRLKMCNLGLQVKFCHNTLSYGIRLHGFPGWLSRKESSWNARDAGEVGSVPGSGRSPGGGNSNPPQYSCLENPIDWGVLQAIVRRISKSWT